MSAVVSDTSPLHYLVECDAIEILPTLFNEVLIPPAVQRELLQERTPPRVRTWALMPPSWLHVRVPAHIDTSLKVDQGEREAISLARELNAAVILMDDRRARAEAIRCGLRVAGTIGVLEVAAHRGLVNFETAITRLRQTNARLDDDVIHDALARLRAR